MRIAILVALLAIAAGVYLFGGRAISEEDVNAFYDRQIRATLSRDPAGLCDLLASDFEGISGTIVNGRLTKEVVGKKDVCAATHEFYDNLKRISAARGGGLLRLSYSQEIVDVAIASDRKTATVRSTYRMTVSGRMMEFDGQSVDTLVRRRWRVVMQGSDQTTTIEMR